jgi:hypothetical protein
MCRDGEEIPRPREPRMGNQALVQGLRQVIDAGEGQHQLPWLGGRKVETPPGSRKRGSCIGF